MRKSVTIIVIVAVIVVGGLVYWHANSGAPAQVPAATETPAAVTPSSAPAPTPTPIPSPSRKPVAPSPLPSASSAPQSFTVNGNDSTADLKTITVPKGTPVTITFGADAQGTYHGGLDFRSSVVSTGPIAPGSTKTVTFTAANSFSFTPYWPSTNIAKPYTINIVVD